MKDLPIPRQGHRKFEPSIHKREARRRAHTFKGCTSIKAACDAFWARRGMVDPGSRATDFENPDRVG